MADDHNAGGQTTYPGVSERVLGQRQHGVPTVGGVFPTPRRRRQPMLDLAAIDRAAQEQNRGIAAAAAEREQREAALKDAADSAFLPAEPKAAEAAPKPTRRGRARSQQP